MKAVAKKDKFSDKEIKKHINSLIPETREVLTAPKEERVVFAMTDKFINYSRAKEILDYFELLIKLPRKPRMKGVLLYGESGTGKTMIVRHFFEKFAPKENEDEDADEIPVVLVETPTEPKERMIYDKIADTLGFPYKKSEDILDKERNIEHYVNFMRVKMIIFDEFHNILNGTAIQQRRVLSVIKSLTNRLWIPIVLVGTKDVLVAVETDDEIKRRFDPYQLHPWSEDKDFLRLLRTVEATLPLRLPSYMWKDEELVRWLIKSTDGILSEIIHLIKLGARRAILSGEERVTLKILKEANPFD
ncbi:TniB family NTP-binding protein [Hippea alviniae]|uniref:TniB family NTP-binding protein n=1 Tax=Hippea alviniae TaxID=1279027 RepID=UPI0003B39944|nr:TniB family NTP-binding protein [Hippea alviniae]